MKIILCSSSKTRILLFLKSSPFIGSMTTQEYRPSALQKNLNHPQVKRVYFDPELDYVLNSKVRMEKRKQGSSAE